MQFNKADREFSAMGKDIFMNGDKIPETRAVWKDGEVSNTLAKFAAKTSYDLCKTFPILSLREQNWKGAIKELLWIHQKYSNNINDLGMKIWDSWKLEDDTIGKSYGYQAGKVYQWKDTPEPMTQIERVLYLLKKEPHSRRMHITLRNNADVTEKALEECAHTIEFMVAGNKLNMILLQRSGDFLTASGPGGWNEIQYAALHLAIAHCSDLIPGTFTHVTTNQHIYNRHFEQVQAILGDVEFRRESGELKEIEPLMKITSKTKDFFQLTEHDFELIGYQPGKKLKGIEVAV